MSLEQRQAKALSILEKMHREPADLNEWAWGLAAAALGCVVIWLMRFW